MKAIAKMVGEFSQENIATIEKNKGWNGTIDGVEISLTMEDFELSAQDIPGWAVASEGDITVALDTTISETLQQEGIARELINRVQNLRKDSGLDVTDKIILLVDTNSEIQTAIEQNKAYVANEVLAAEIAFKTLNGTATEVDLVDEKDAKIAIEKAN